MACDLLNVTDTHSMCVCLRVQLDDRLVGFDKAHKFLFIYSAGKNCMLAHVQMSPKFTEKELNFVFCFSFLLSQNKLFFYFS